MAGAVINSLRYEFQETGELPYGKGPTPIPNPCAALSSEEREQASSARSSAQSGRS